MIISCEKCNKKFEIDNNLIPKKGRLLQCGSCSHQWHYKPKDKPDKPDIPDEAVELNNEVFQDQEITDDSKNNKIKISKKEKIKENEKKESINKINFLNILAVTIISFVALILVIETFKFQISNLIPDIDFYLFSLYESLKDIYLFLKDLLK
tara:strand:- start:36 stop:491 length:456 start_codon:yes stop_codon:yes gene_type:complete